MPVVQNREMNGPRLLFIFEAGMALGSIGLSPDRGKRSFLELGGIAREHFTCEPMTLRGY